MHTLFCLRFHDFILRPLFNYSSERKMLNKTYKRVLPTKISLLLFLQIKVIVIGFIKKEIYIENKIF